MRPVGKHSLPAPIDSIAAKGRVEYDPPAMSHTFSFVRHGSTEFNERRIFIGSLDVPLSARGARQALASGDSIDRDAFDVVYTSPLARAFQTAAIVTGLARPIFQPDGSWMLQYITAPDLSPGLPLIADPRLAERSFGELQGVSHLQVEDRFPHYRGRSVTQSFSDRPTGGESFADLEHRVTAFLRELSKRHRDTRFLVFSHNGPIRIAAKYFLGLSEQETLERDNPHCELLTFTQ